LVYTYYLVHIEYQLVGVVLGVVENVVHEKEQQVAAISRYHEELLSLGGGHELGEELE
jgi:hypothetical protein